MILMNSERWPLIIDPQLQGLKWLKEQFKDNLCNLKMTDKGWVASQLKKLQKAQDELNQLEITL